MSAFEDAVIDLAQTFAWKCAHFRPAQTKHGWRTPVSADGKGFPDLVLVGHGRVLFRELKTGRSALTVEQRQWGAWLCDAGADWSVWRDSEMGPIVALLSLGKASAL